MRSGLMYSNPSNSDWSIFLTTSLQWTEGNVNDQNYSQLSVRRIKCTNGHSLIVWCELDRLVGELGVKVVQSKLP